MLVQVTVGIKARNVEKVKKIEIKKEEDRNGVLSNFVYPMIGLCGLSVL